MDLLSNPLRMFGALFVLTLPAYGMFMAVHEWKGVVLTTALLVGMSFVMGFETATRCGGEE